MMSFCTGARHLRPALTCSASWCFLSPTDVKLFCALMASVRLISSRLLPPWGASCQTVLASITSLALPPTGLADRADSTMGRALMSEVEGATVFMVNAIIAGMQREVQRAAIAPNLSPNLQPYAALEHQ